MKKLKEVMNPITNDGLFKILYTLRPDTLWLNADNYSHLDNYYLLGFSANKYISSLYNNLLDLESKGSINSALVEFAKIVIDLYMDNWDRIYEAYITDYKPLENYSMVENERVKSKITSKVGSKNDTYGFNSSSAVPTNEVTSTSVTEGSKDDNDRDLVRSGNIGVTTSQQMLESEIKLRQYKFYDQVCKDIDKVLCLKIY